VSNPGIKNILKILLPFAACGLAACTHNAPAPVFDLYSSTASKQSFSKNKSTSERPRLRKSDALDSYVVKPGDTLYSIAWYHAIDVKELSKNNQIKNNTIFPGQKLNLRKMEVDGYFDSDSLLLALNSEVLNNKVPERKVAKLDRSRSKKNSKTLKKVKLASIEKKSSVQKRTLMNRSRTIKNSNLNWIWPTDGKVLSRFSNSLNSNRGLDIAGNKGQAVRASASGKVVYEGSGLRGYGKLVIIKHDNDYLSAYAHNDKVYVSENEVVKAGQRIADIGSSGTQMNKLHFEIRYKGKPVDPLNYLPNRKI